MRALAGDSPRLPRRNPVVSKPGLGHHDSARSTRRPALFDRQKTGSSNRKKVGGSHVQQQPFSRRTFLGGLSAAALLSSGTKAFAADVPADWPGGGAPGT